MVCICAEDVLSYLTGQDLEVRTSYLGWLRWDESTQHYVHLWNWNSLINKDLSVRWCSHNTDCEISQIFAVRGQESDVHQGRSNERRKAPTTHYNIQ